MAIIKKILIICVFLNNYFFTTRTSSDVGPGKQMGSYDKTTRLYDPEFGFENYWPGGEWKLFGKTIYPPNTLIPDEVTTTTTTEKPPLVCGAECPKQYRNITEVCYFASRERIIESMEYYHTGTYCEFLQKANPKCTFGDFMKIEYNFVHVGRCLPNIVQNFTTPRPAGPIYKMTYYDWFTPDTFEMGPSARMKKFFEKFTKEDVWTKFYPGKPYPTPFQNFP